jgi:hypothetical protein
MGKRVVQVEGNEVPVSLKFRLFEAVAEGGGHCGAHSCFALVLLLLAPLIPLLLLLAALAHPIRLLLLLLLTLALLWSPPT